MIKIHKYIDEWSSTIEDRWKLLGPKQQRKYVVIFFTGYIIITIAVLLFAWNQGQKNRPNHKDTIRHIGNPTLKSKARFQTNIINLHNRYHERTKSY